MQQAAREATGLHVVDWMPAVLLRTPRTLTYVLMTQASSTHLRQARPTIPIPDTPKMIAIDNLSHYRVIPLLSWLIPLMTDPLMQYPLTVDYCDVESTVATAPETVQ
jgi:hypothetical protein